MLCGEFPAPGDTVTVEPRGFGRQAEADIVRAEVSFDITDAITASYLFGYIEAETVTANTAENDTVTCLSIIPGRCNFQASPLGFLDYTSHEARLTYDNDGPFSGAIGAFVLNGIDQNFFISINPPAGLTDPFRITPDSGVGFLVRNEETDTDVKSVFVELNYSFADDRARIGAEARYTSETIFTENIRTPALTQPEEEFTFFTPRITFEYDLTDDSLLFASVARAQRLAGLIPVRLGSLGHSTLSSTGRMSSARKISSSMVGSLPTRRCSLPIGKISKSTRRIQAPQTRWLHPLQEISATPRFGA